MTLEPRDVDVWLERLLNADDAATAAASEKSRAAGLADIAVSPLQGKLLMILAAAAGARRILEIGALGGYSTIWLARAAGADGAVVTLEIDPVAARVVRANAEAAGVGAIIEVVEGAALPSLDAMIARKTAPFDFVFIDADKESYPAYLDRVLLLVRAGALVIADNVVRKGAVADETSDDPRVVGVRAYLEKAGSDPRLHTTAIQTVGAKGHDGLAISVVRGL
ncbi:MAG: O-methyltransferase [Parvularculaceae bacterium]|nr:O-methyltransferase [Parvularculaceae bacterium]